MRNRSQNIAFNARAFFLAVLIFIAFGGKELHILLEHSHEEVKICDAQNGEKHLHDKDYIHSDCTLCDFTFSTFEFQFPVFVLKNSIYIAIEGEFSFQTSFFSNTLFSKSSRGPPTPMSI